MSPVTAVDTAALAGLCRRLGVRRLELFGSATRADFDPSRSDVDFVVEFDDDAKRPVLGSWFELKAGLEQLYGRHVDLVSAGAVRNPYVRAAIDADRRLVFDADA